MSVRPLVVLALMYRDVIAWLGSTTHIYDECSTVYKNSHGPSTYTHTAQQLYYVQMIHTGYSCTSLVKMLYSTHTYCTVTTTRCRVAKLPRPHQAGGMLAFRMKKPLQYVYLDMCLRKKLDHGPGHVGATRPGRPAKGRRHA